MSLIVECEGAVTIVTLNRPESRNAVDPATALALREAFETFEADDDAPVSTATRAGGRGGRPP